MLYLIHLQDQCISGDIGLVAAVERRYDSGKFQSGFRTEHAGSPVCFDPYFRPVLSPWEHRTPGTGCLGRKPRGWEES